MNPPDTKIATAQELAHWLQAGFTRSQDLTAGLSYSQLMGPQLDTVNPMLWELGHVAWFHERWSLRALRGLPPLLANGDLLYDSFETHHSTRWSIPLPPPEKTLAYIRQVLEVQLEWLDKSPPDERAVYFYRLGGFHEDMHNEAYTYTRQALGYPPPVYSDQGSARQAEGVSSAGPLAGDVDIPGCQGFLLGGTPAMPFVFDNEKWAHPVDVAPFSMARAPVTNAGFLAFVEDGGYDTPDWWTAAGWDWRTRTGASRPVYWAKRQGGRWESRRFDRWEPLPPHQPVIHVNWFEATAWCRWAGRRLPTEAEWELAAGGAPELGGRPELGAKFRFPWGDTPPTPQKANLDGQAGWVVDVAAHPEGDSPTGCRQMAGNVWEWTESPFYPFPGFVTDPYREYSAPWFGYRKVLKGGCWATRSRTLRNTWRNFYLPDRRDVLSGFRTCAL